MADTTGLGDVLSGPVTPPNMTPDPAQPIVPGPSASAGAEIGAAFAPPAETTGAVQGPSVHQNADGSTFIVHRGRPVTIVDGYPIRAPNGQILVWRDGQWNPA